MGVTENVIVGGIISVGTGTVELVMHHIPYLKNITTESKDSKESEKA